MARGNVYFSWVFLAAFLCVAKTAEAAQPPDDSWWQIVPGERVGRITRDTSEEQIIQIFGADNVRRDNIYLGEGETSPGTVIFPNDLTKKLEILWKDAAERKNPAEARIKGRSSQWKTQTGLSLGSTLRQIEKLNGKPFILAGFAWDYQGTIIDCNQGRFKELGCVDPKRPSRKIQGRKIILRLIPDEKTSALPEYRAVQGDRYFSSGHPAMQKLNPRVHEKIILFEPQ
jgi:hypothetical protein